MQENTIAHFQERLSLYIKSRFPLIYVVTWEEEGTIDALRYMIGQPKYFKQERDVFTWSLTQELTLRSNRRIYRVGNRRTYQFGFNRCLFRRTQSKGRRFHKSNSNHRPAFRHPGRTN